LAVALLGRGVSIYLAYLAPFQFDEAAPDRDNNGVDAVKGIKAVEDISQVLLNGVLADIKVGGDFLAGQAFPDKPDDFRFPGGQLSSDLSHKLASIKKVPYLPGKNRGDFSYKKGR